MNFISNIISNSVSGFVEAGTRTAGGFAGDALIKAGDLIESTGRGVGTGIEGAATGYGTKIAGQGPVNTVKGAAPKKAITAGKPAGVQRSYSSPASSSAKKTPLGANKYPGGKTAVTPLGANKYPAGKTAVTPLGANKYPGGKTTGTPLGASKYPGAANPAATKKPALNGTPKPYPGTSSKSDASKPKAYPGTNTVPTKANTPKPKVPGAVNGAAKPYPGTSTLPGSGKKTAVQAGKPKAMSTAYAPPSKAGDTFSRHLPDIKV